MSTFSAAFHSTMRGAPENSVIVQQLCMSLQQENRLHCSPSRIASELRTRFAQCRQHAWHMPQQHLSLDSGNSLERLAFVTAESAFDRTAQRLCCR